MYKWNAQLSYIINHQNNIFIFIIIDLESLWTTWNAWFSCTESCDGGIQTRTRTCEDDSNSVVESCTGSSNQTRSCNDVACPGSYISMTIIVQIETSLVFDITVYASWIFL